MRYIVKGLKDDKTECLTFSSLRNAELYVKLSMEDKLYDKCKIIKEEL